MKILVTTFAIALLLIACQEEPPKDYVTLSGTITNQNSDSLVIVERKIIKTIKVKVDGTFSDTLKVTAGNFALFDGSEQTSIYLKNGYDLKINLDTKAFDESIVYAGKGEEPNNYLAKNALIKEEIIDFEGLMNMEKVNFDKNMMLNKGKLLSLLDGVKNLDTVFVSEQRKNIDMMGEQFEAMYEEKQAVLALNGTNSPKFTDYENYAGGTTSLDDLKGKYVYIDLWATWCGPCKEEIPALKEVEKAYHGKNIAFVSISIDRKDKYEAWKAMIAEKELTGIQLYASEDQKFMNDYKVSGIPRFILIDPTGTVVNADAPRPSSPTLSELFIKLSI